MSKTIFYPGGLVMGRNAPDPRRDDGLQRRELTLRLDAGGRPASLDEAARSVEVVVATEQPVKVYDPKTWGIIDEVLLMSRVRMPKTGRIPLLDTHDRWTTDAVLGSARDLRVKGKQMLAAAVFAETGRGAEVFPLVGAGHITDVSVGYRVYEHLRISEGEKSEVDGKTYKGPLLVALDWEPFELSFCPVGADDNAKTRAVPGTPEKPQLKEATMEWYERMRQLLGLPEGTSKDKVLGELRQRMALPDDADEAKIREAMEKRAMEPAHKDESKQPGSDDLPGRAAQDHPDEVKAAVDLAMRAERQRMVEIRALCVRHGLDSEADAMITEGRTLDQARELVLAKVEARQQAMPEGSHRVEMGTDERDKFRGAAQDSLLLRAGIRVETPAAGAQDLMSYTLRDLCRDCLVRSGQRVSGNVLDMTGRAMTTTDLPNILSNVANLSLQEGWEGAEENWETWCASGSLNDFKPATLARAGEFDDLEEVPEDGEYKRGTVSDAKETVQLATYGKIFAISRQAIINDDLGALTDVPRKMGEAAARKVGDLPYAVLNANAAMGDGVALFHTTTHKNLASSGAVVSVATLDAGYLAMASQKDLSGKRRLNIRPMFLLAPLAKMGFINQFFKTKEIGGATNQPNLENTYYDSEITRIFDGRLDDTSTTAWYLIGPKGKVIKVFFLNGMKTPFLEMQNGWTVDGVEHKVRIDAAAKALDYRGAYKNPGE